LTEKKTIVPQPSKYTEYFTQFSEEKECNKVMETHKKVKLEIQSLRERYNQLEAEVHALKGQTEPGRCTAITFGY